MSLAPLDGDQVSHSDVRERSAGVSGAERRGQCDPSLPVETRGSLVWGVSR